MKRSSARLAAIGVGALFLVGACGNGAGQGATDNGTATDNGAATENGTTENGAVDDGASNGAEEISAELSEWAIDVTPSSASAGSVTFDTENGGDQEHELVVVDTDLAADDLPTDETRVDEDAEGVDVIDRTDVLESGDSGSLSTDLDAGEYVLICNVEGHYQSGMHTTFEVT